MYDVMYVVMYALYAKYMYDVMYMYVVMYALYAKYMYDVMYMYVVMYALYACVRLALWTHTFFCGRVYASCTNFHSFIHASYMYVNDALYMFCV